MFDLIINGATIEVPVTSALEVWVDEYWTVQNIDNWHLCLESDGTYEFRKQHHSDPIKFYAYETVREFIDTELLNEDCDDDAGPFGAHLVKERTRVF